MTVVEHRSPYKRIEIGSPAMERRLSTDVITEAKPEVGTTERDRIWVLVEQSARGVNVPTEDRGEKP